MSSTRLHQTGQLHMGNSRIEAGRPGRAGEIRRGQRDKRSVYTVGPRYHGRSYARTFTLYELTRRLQENHGDFFIYADAGVGYGILESVFT